MTTKKLKIGVVVGIFPAASEAFIINQIEFLSKQGHQIDVLATRQVNFEHSDLLHPELSAILKSAILLTKEGLIPKSKRARICKVLHVLFDRRSKAFRKDLLKSLNVFKIGRKALTLRPFYRLYYKWYFEFKAYDVVHIHFGDNAVQLLDQIKNFSNKVVVSFHGYDVHKYDANFYKDLVNLEHIEYTVNTNFTLHKLLALNFKKEKATIIPVGLNTTFFNSKSDSVDDLFRILFVGRLVAFKAPLLAIEIVHEFINKHDINNIEFIIVGEGKEYNSCSAYIEKNGLYNVIKLVGRKSQEEIKSLMNRSSLFLFPGIIDQNGRCENQGLVIQEAQSMRLPVLASDVGGIKDGIRDGVTGFVLQEKDKSEFIEKLFLLYDNLDLRHRMGANARKFIVDTYDSRILGAKLLNLFSN